MNIKGIHIFLGHAGFYRWFIKDFSQIARPLKNAFLTLKKALISAPIIQPPDWSLPFEIMCDASDYVVGAVLDQTKDKKHHVIAYGSKTLIGT